MLKIENVGGTHEKLARHTGWETPVSITRSWAGSLIA